MSRSHFPFASDAHIKSVQWSGVARAFTARGRASVVAYPSHQHRNVVHTQRRGKSVSPNPKEGGGRRGGNGGAEEMSSNVGLSSAEVIARADLGQFSACPRP